MQIPGEIAALYEQSGPFATAFLDATRAKEQGGEEVRLRWQSVREQLVSDGADEPTLAAMDEVVGGHREVPGEHGQLVVGAAGRVLLDRVTPRRPAQPVARWSALPHLMPYLAHTAPQIPHVIVVADRTGADLATVSASAAVQGAPADWDRVQGGNYPIHRTSRSDWSERHFQNRVENSWAENARSVATEVAKHVAAIGAQLVVVIGDERARSLLMRDLPHALPADVTLVDSAEGGRGAGASPEALDDYGVDLTDIVIMIDEEGRPGEVLDRSGRLRPVRDWLRVSVDTPVPQAAHRALTRSEGARFQPLLCIDNAGRFLGLVRMERILDFLASASMPSSAVD